MSCRADRCRPAAQSGEVGDGGMIWNTTCHCGAVSVQLAKAPEELAECNCSLCFSHGILWAYMSPRDVVIEGATRTYNRSEEHTSELQSLMRISYAVFCLKKKKNK